MHNYDRTASVAPGSYDRQLQRVVKVVDTMMDGVKYVARSKRMLDDIANLASQDPELDKNQAFAVKQQVEGLKKAIDDIAKASDEMGFYYDELNGVLLRLKRR